MITKESGKSTFPISSWAPKSWDKCPGSRLSQEVSIKPKTSYPRYAAKGKGKNTIEIAEAKSPPLMDGQSAGERLVRTA